MKKLIWICVVVFFVVVVLFVARGVTPYYLVPNSIPGSIPLSAGERNELLSGDIERIEALDSVQRERVLRYFADRDTSGFVRDNRSGGVKLSQTILANLMLGERIEPCNTWLRELVVWGNAGSSWERNEHGDYDFGLIWLTRILYEFGDEDAVLHPASRDYLLNTLLTEQGRLNLKVPKTGGLVFDTENHLLMREGSRYLKNQWLKTHGSVPARLDNDRNGLGAWLEGYLNHLLVKGVYEYNSTPYVVYTMLPLMNLAEYAEPQTIRRLARAVMDNILERYAYGSLGLRQCAPFRRQFKYAEDPSLRLNRLGALVTFQRGQEMRSNDLLAFGAIVNDYRMPKDTLRWFANGAQEDYYAVFAHEAQGGAELYSGGPGYLLSAGGTYQGRAASVITRPIALLLEDAATKLDDCIHIKGIGDWKSWNMSGVHHRFAVARGTIHLPERLGHAVKSGWNVVRVGRGMEIAYYQKDDLAILLVLPPNTLSLDARLRLLQAENPRPEESNTFVWPAELAPTHVKSMVFDIDAEPAEWVITSVDAEGPKPMPSRSFEAWPAKYIQ